MPELPKDNYQRRQKLLAVDFNRVAAWIRALASGTFFRAGEGIEISADRQGVLIALARSRPDRVQFGVVVETSGQAVDWPDQVAYTVRIEDRPELGNFTVPPARIVRDVHEREVKVRKAANGSPVIVVAVPRAGAPDRHDHWVLPLAERVYRRPCQ